MRQINKEIAEDAAYREIEIRTAMATGLGYILGGAAMGDDYAIRLLRVAAEVAALNIVASSPEKAAVEQP